MQNKQLENALTLLVRVLDTPQARDFAIMYFWDGIFTAERYDRKYDHGSEVTEHCLIRKLSRYVNEVISDNVEKSRKEEPVDRGRFKVIDLLLLTGSERKVELAVKAIRLFANTKFIINEDLTEYERAQLGDFLEPLKALDALLVTDDNTKTK